MKFNKLLFLSVLTCCSCIVPRKMVFDNSQWDMFHDRSPSLYYLTPQSYRDTCPEIYYHSTTNEHLDEIGVIKILLDLRHVAVFCSFAENMILTCYSGKSINSAAEDSTVSQDVLLKTFNYIKELDENGYLLYGLDYLWAPKNMNRNFKLLSGEGFPPFEPGYEPPEEIRHSYENVPVFDSRFPAFTANAPNGDFYPKANRYLLFTTPVEEISTGYGDIVLVIKEQRKRGLPLPAYCISKHGASSLTDSCNISYWEKGDREEYVIPAYIPGSDVISAVIKTGYKKGVSEGSIVRKYSRQNSGSVVNVENASGNVVATIELDSLGVVPIPKILSVSGFENDPDLRVVSELLNKSTGASRE